MKRVIQTATSGTRRQPPRGPRPSTPWKASGPADIPEEVAAANPGLHLKWVRTRNNDRTRLDQKIEEGYVEPKLPKGVPALRGDKTSIASAYQRRDCQLMGLPDERWNAREWAQFDRAEAQSVHRAEELRDAAARRGFKPGRDEITEGEVNAKDLVPG